MHTSCMLQTICKLSHEPQALGLFSLHPSENPPKSCMSCHRRRCNFSAERLVADVNMGEEREGLAHVDSVLGNGGVHVVC